MAAAMSKVIFSQAPELVELGTAFARRRGVCVPPRPPAGHSMHVTRFLWAALREQGVHLPARIPQPHPGGPKHDGRGRQGRVGNGVSAVALHPGSGSPRKNLPLGCWLKTAKILEKRGDAPIWVLGPAETELKTALEQDGTPARRLWHTDDLTALAAKLEAVHGLIGHDSGISHMAAFLGVPVLAVFGPSDPRRWRPWGARVKVLRADPDCRPCFETEAANCAAADCWKGITAKAIVAAWEQWQRQLPIA